MKNTKQMVHEGNRETRARCAIIVLGCRPYQRDGSINPELKARVGKGIELFQRGFGDVVVFTGGCVASQVPEAAVMKSLAPMIPKQSVMLELHACSTRENAVLTKRMLLQKGMRKAIIVTSPYHHSRALRIFNRVWGIGFSVAGVSCDFVTPWPRSWWLALVEWAKEYLPLPEPWLQRMGNWSW